MVFDIYGSFERRLRSAKFIHFKSSSVASSKSMSVCIMQPFSR